MTSMKHHQYAISVDIFILIILSILTLYRRFRGILQPNQILINSGDENDRYENKSR